MCVRSALSFMIESASWDFKHVICKLLAQPSVYNIWSSPSNFFNVVLWWFFVYVRITSVMRVVSTFLFSAHHRTKFILQGRQLSLVQQENVYALISSIYVVFNVVFLWSSSTSDALVAGVCFLIPFHGSSSDLSIQINIVVTMIAWSLCCLSVSYVEPVHHYFLGECCFGSRVHMLLSEKKKSKIVKYI